MCVEEYVIDILLHKKSMKKCKEHSKKLYAKKEKKREKEDEKDIVLDKASCKKQYTGMKLSCKDKFKDGMDQVEKITPKRAAHVGSCFRNAFSEYRSCLDI